MATSRGEAKGDEEAVEGEKGDQPARKASGRGGSGERLPVAGFCFPREVAETDGQEVAEGRRCRSFRATGK